MKNFILQTDFKAIATDEDLEILSDNNSKIISQCNKIAIDEASAYISTKYDVTKLFADPIEFQSDTAYLSGARLYVVELSDGSPQVETGEVIHYTCIKDVTGIESPAIEITNDEYFEEIDNRDQKLLEVVMSISLFYIHKRLTPNNIPAFRVMAYDGNGDTNIMSAIKWLGLIQKGLLSPYNWVLLSDTSEEEDPEVPIDYDKLGNDPATGMMWGNDMCEDYIWYDNKHDKNIIKKE